MVRDRNGPEHSQQPCILTLKNRQFSTFKFSHLFPVSDGLSRTGEYFLY